MSKTTTLEMITFLESLQKDITLVGGRRFDLSELYNMPLGDLILLLKNNGITFNYTTKVPS